MSTSRLFWLILALGIAVRTALVVLLHVPLTIDFAEMEKIARSLAEYGAFANPYAVPTGPTAHHAPVYPFLLNFVFRALGYGYAAALAMALMNFAFASLQWALMPLLAERAGLPRSVGIVTAVMGALLPYRLLRETRWETSLVAAAVAVLVFLTLRWWQRRTLTVVHSAAIGAAWGVGTMCSANFLLVFPLVLVVIVYRAAPFERSRWLQHAAMSAVGFIVAVTPWTIRNYAALHGFVPTRSNFGIEFSVSNNADAHVLAVDNYLVGYPNNYFHLHHPWSNRAEAREVARLGEIAYNRRRVAETVDWIRSHPRQFASLTSRRVLFFWFTPYTTQPWKNVVLTPLSLLAMFGMFIAVRRGLELGWLFAALWIGYPLVYYVMQTDTRYRYPIEWSFALLAVYAAYNVVSSRLPAIQSWRGAVRLPAPVARR
jgi:hypothetical protein